MLRTLSILNFVIVDAIELEFSAGFSVLTGETGAGKSILIDALALVLGGRADPAVVREGASRADVSADFLPGIAATAWLEAHQLALDDGGCLMRRTVDTAGRSKAYINGITATATQLRELGELLVDIHGQHAHQSLLKPALQRELFDAQAGLSEQAARVRERYEDWRAIARQREQLQRDARQVLLDRERLQWQVDELEKLSVKPGEWDEIVLEHRRLTHASSLIEGIQEALMALSESDEAILSRLSSVNGRLIRLQEIDPLLLSALECLEPARIQLQETVYALNDHLGRIEIDPQRLAEVESRMNALHACARKCHVPPKVLPATYDDLVGQLAKMSDACDFDALERREQVLEAEYRQLAKGLSGERQRAATRLGEAVTETMQALGMGGGCFEVTLLPCEPASSGLEQIEFRVAGHTGGAPRALAKVASGGELARIALAISVIASNATATPTLIFDEVDSGVGGAVAQIVGRLLRRLGISHQVLCVTHLPQVASQADTHFHVAKAAQSDGRTLSSIRLLDARERVEEVARMLGGVDITATTRKHAREMLAL